MLLDMEQVYVFEVEDADAGSWTAEVAVAASKPVEATRRIRAAGLHKKQIRNDARPVRVVGPAEVRGIDKSPTGIVRRRREDAGWTEWEPLAADTSLNWRVSGAATAQTRGSGHR
ncbi:hypothetical protein [uncultured Cellulomonas sp.]|uniref:hypothetical protein n=1 Tax=uncultured Cellulomonas sp. TaxID=189682 RepID=UPI0026356C1E|nr:hypothetical protein [uncultured Cellulomonas sp.]